MKFCFTCILVVSINLAFGQSKSFTIKQIDSLVTKINSVKKYYTVIEDGIVTNIRKGLIKKVFVKKKTGSYSATYFSDSATNKIAKIIYGQSYNHSFYKNEFFYKDDSLIFVNTSKRQESMDFDTTSYGKFYFQQGVLIKKNGNDSTTKPPILMKNARRMLSQYYDFQNQKNHQ